ncbi:MAG: hypothetical protein IKW81_06425, partial [Pseudobutyrivibrio sp.]|nr:hypothetical protein [Pseudobutyrivibrio sp.]
MVVILSVSPTITAYASEIDDVSVDISNADDGAEDKTEDILEDISDDISDDSNQEKDEVEQDKEISDAPIDEEIKDDDSKLILEQPVDQYKLIGEDVTFSVVGADEVDSYSWFYSKDNGDTWDIFYCNGRKTNKIEFNVKIYQYGYLLRCEVTKGDYKQISEPARLLDRETVILEHPQNVKVKTGDPVSLTVLAEGNKLTYNWYYNNGDGNWNKCWSYYDSRYKENRKYEGNNKNIL